MKQGDSSCLESLTTSQAKAAYREVHPSGPDTTPGVIRATV